MTTSKEVLARYSAEMEQAYDKAVNEPLRIMHRQQKKLLKLSNRILNKRLLDCNEKLQLALYRNMVNRSIEKKILPDSFTKKFFRWTIKDFILSEEPDFMQTLTSFYCLQLAKIAD